ncbi:DUF6177 family protein [Thermomonospora echinospora]|nr:DUF6177 family protein [Thermomonospora echinospora]
MSGHPAVDIVTAKSTVVIQDRPLVPLSSWLTDVMARCAGTGQVLQVLTPHDARITLPLRLALGGPRARWVVQEPGDGYYDGFSGLPLIWDGAMFTPAVQERPEPSATFLRRPPGDLGHHLVVDLRVRHKATTDLELGGAAEALARALAGTAPRCWGTAEPALVRWSQSELTALCRRRSPRATWLAYMGPHEAGSAHPPFGGTIRVSRVTSGVKETVAFTVSYGPGREPPLEELAALADRYARAGVLQVLTAQWAPGGPDLTYPARWQGAPVPVALAVGPEGVAETGAAHAAASDGGRAIGDPGAPGMWYVLGDGTDTGAWNRLGDLMERLGGPRR